MEEQKEEIINFFYLPIQDKKIEFLILSKCTDGALVRVITPVYGNEKIEEAEARLAGFTRDVVPILDGFLPK